MENNRLKSIEDSLANGGKDAVMAVLEQIREIGVPKLLPALVKVYKSCGDDDVKMAVFKLLCDASQPGLVDVMAETIAAESDANVKQMLVTSCWYSKIDYLPRLELFIDLVFDAPFELAFEAFTVVENRQGSISDERRTELISYIENRLAETSSANESLAESLSEIVKNYDK
ncbi:MAG: hypothetical protein J6T98_10985 [Salinivirgaceae bacterium]|nr:hypothetical protein [Salinivirgaceae bacterium]